MKQRERTGTGWRRRWDRRKVQEETANDPQPFRCMECNEPVSHINPELTPCRCARAVAAEW